MSDFDKLHKWLYDYDCLRGYSNAFDQCRQYAVEHFRSAVCIALEALEQNTQKEKPKHTIADNYPAGGLTAAEPCMFCEDFEKLQAENERLKTWLIKERIITRTGENKMSESLKEFEKWWNKVSMEEGWDYEEYAQRGWEAALEWIYYDGVIGDSLAGDLIKEELENERM